MILGAALCVFIVSFAACNGEEKFSEISDWASADGMQAEKKRNEMLEAFVPREDNRCYGKPCTGNDDCCVGAVCVDIEGASGTCLPTYVKRFHQACEEDKDCEAGYVCLESGSMKSCQLEGRPRPTRGYNDPCSTSSECDTARGLCCQVLRRHRMAAKKVCHYFIDPMSCVGDVQTDLKPLHYIPNPFFKARLG